MQCVKCLLLNTDSFKTKKSILKVVLSEIDRLPTETYLKIITPKRLGNLTEYLLDGIDLKYTKNHTIKIRVIKSREINDYILRIWKF